MASIYERKLWTALATITDQPQTLCYRKLPTQLNPTDTWARPLKQTEHAQTQEYTEPKQTPRLRRFSRV